MPRNPVVFCFVAAEDYSEFRRVCTDGSDMPTDYMAFAENAIQFMEKMKRGGVVPVKMYIKPADLVAWCRANGRSVDANARTDYAARCFIESEGK